MRSEIQAGPSGPVYTFSVRWQRTEGPRARKNSGQPATPVCKHYTRRALRHWMGISTAAAVGFKSALLFAAVLVDVRVAVVVDPVVAGVDLRAIATFVLNAVFVV